MNMTCWQRKETLSSELIPIEISSYGEEIGVTFKSPKYKELPMEE